MAQKLLYIKGNIMHLYQTYPPAQMPPALWLGAFPILYD